MPKKLHIWLGRSTTFEYGGMKYHGEVISTRELYDPRTNYFFKTVEGESFPISANGPNRVRCINGGLVGTLRRTNAN